MSKIRKEYERSIEPHMKVITAVAKEFQIPMFATYQTEPDQFKTFCLNEQRSNWHKIKYMIYLNDTWNFDQFIEAVMEDAIEHGHNSAVLHAMGIPFSPKQNSKNAQTLKTLFNDDEGDQ